jgi:hypothetical protein
MKATLNARLKILLSRPSLKDCRRVALKFPHETGHDPTRDDCRHGKRSLLLPGCHTQSRENFKYRGPKAFPPLAALVQPSGRVHLVFAT